MGDSELRRLERIVGECPEDYETADALGKCLARNGIPKPDCRAYVGAVQRAVRERNGGSSRAAAFLKGNPPYVPLSDPAQEQVRFVLLARLDFYYNPYGGLVEGYVHETSGVRLARRYESGGMFIEFPEGSELLTLPEALATGEFFAYLFTKYKIKACSDGWFYHGVYEEDLDTARSHCDVLPFDIVDMRASEVPRWLFDTGWFPPPDEGVSDPLQWRFRNGTTLADRWPKRFKVEEGKVVYR